MAEYPQLLHTVLDSTTPRELAEFSRHVLGLRYRLGDEPPADGAADSADLPVLVDSAGMRSLAFQQVDQLAGDLPPGLAVASPGLPSVTSQH